MKDTRICLMHNNDPQMSLKKIAKNIAKHQEDVKLITTLNRQKAYQFNKISSQYIKMYPVRYGFSSLTNFILEFCRLSFGPLDNQKENIIIDYPLFTAHCSAKRLFSDCMKASHSNLFMYVGDTYYDKAFGDHLDYDLYDQDKTDVFIKEI